MTATATALEGAELLESDGRPIVAIFYAPWYEQSTRAIPAVEKELAAYGDKFKLVKINVDEYQELAAALGARCIPTTLGLHGGRTSCGFTGTPSPRDIRDFLSTVEKFHNDTPPQERGRRRIPLLKPLQFRRAGPA